LNAPLYVTGTTPEGKPLVGGIFRMKDEQGFPLDSSYDYCRESGLAIDYLELLCDAWLNSPEKYDAVVAELNFLGGSHEDAFKLAGAIWLAAHPEAMAKENPIDEFCRAVLEFKLMNK
jgi:hypothetical protein